MSGLSPLFLAHDAAIRLARRIPRGYTISRDIPELDCKETLEELFITVAREPLTFGRP